MRRCFAFLCALALLMLCVKPSKALEGQVVYVDDAKDFIFLPGSEESPTDLFPEFKDVMPGDSILQPILVKNDASNKCKVKIYMRALGGHEDSIAFLSQLNLTVAKGTDTIMFDAPADQTAQLSDWVYLGTLYSGGECELMVTLDVPVTLDNQFKNAVGYLDWEFAVEKFPVEPSDPENPETGDDSQLLLWTVLMVGSMVMLVVLLQGRKEQK